MKLGVLNACPSKLSKHFHVTLVTLLLSKVRPGLLWRDSVLDHRSTQEYNRYVVNASSGLKTADAEASKLDTTSSLASRRSCRQSSAWIFPTSARSRRMTLS